MTTSVREHLYSLSMDERLELAKHEVGHGLMASLLGFSVEALELTPSGGQAYCAGHGEALERGEHVICVATNLALVAAAGEAVSEVPMSASDCEDLRRAIWLASLGDYYVIRSFALKRSAERLEPYKAAIGRIAEELSARGCLSGDEFRALLGEEAT
jgi:hypothetical protein